MKKPLLSFALKCFVILYFAACTNIEEFTVAKTVTPVVTHGTWKVSVYIDTNNNQTNDFAGYTFTFSSAGTVKATKNGLDTEGNWSEDNIARKVTINFNTAEPTLTKLNDCWDIAGINNVEVSFQKQGIGTLNITNL